MRTKITELPQLSIIYTSSTLHSCFFLINELLRYSRYNIKERLEYYPVAIDGISFITHRQSLDLQLYISSMTV